MDSQVVVQPQTPQRVRSRDARDPAGVPGGHAALASLAAIGVPVVLMTVLGVVGLGRQSGVWQDEAASMSAAGRTLPQLIGMLHNVDVVHGFYYVVLHAWLVPGGGIVWARTLSLIAMVVAAGLVAELGRRLVSPGLGLLAGLVFAVNPMSSFYAQEARSPGIVVMVALAATLLLVLALERRALRWWVAYASVCVLLVLFNELALLALAAHAVTVLWWTWRSDVRRQTWLRWFVAAVPAVVVAGALAYVSHLQAQQVGWISLSSGAFRRLVGLWSGQTVTGLVVALVLCALALLPPRTASLRRLRAVALPLAVVPPAGLLAASLVQPLLVPRYILFTTAGVSLLCAIGAERLADLVRRGRPAWTGVATLALVLLVLVVGEAPRQMLNRTPASRVDDTLWSADVVGRLARPGDGVLFAPSLRRLDALTSPQAFRGLDDVSLAQDAVAADNLWGSELPLPEVESNLRAEQRVWVVGAPNLHISRGAGAADAQAELALLDQSFRVEQTFPNQGSTVVLYVRSAG